MPKLPSVVARNPYCTIARNDQNQPVAASLLFCAFCHSALANALDDSCPHEQRIQVEVWRAEADTSLVGLRFHSIDWEGRVLNRVTEISFLVQIGPRDPARTQMFASWLSYQPVKIVNVSDMATWTFVAD